MDHQRARALLDRQFAEGVLPAPEAEALHAHLRSCEVCRDAYDRRVDLERGLAGDPAATADEVARLLARGLPEPAVEAPRLIAPRRRMWTSALAAAAVLVVGLSLGRREVTSELTARSGGPSQGRQAWIRVFTASEGAPPKPVNNDFSAQDQLLFSYTNLTDSPFPYLAIAGRDSLGRVHWYYPAYQSAGEHPRSISIKTGVADEELSDAIRTSPSAGLITVCALFTAQPLDVAAVDQALEQSGQWPTDGLQDCRILHVKRSTP
jgi:hypothetical protein